MTPTDNYPATEGASMAILTNSRLPGDPHELLAHARRTAGRRMRDVAARHGQLAQVIVDEGDGLRLFDLWESERGMLRACEEMRSVADIAVPVRWEWRQWDVLHHQIYVTPTRADGASPHYLCPCHTLGGTGSKRPITP